MKENQDIFKKLGSASSRIVNLGTHLLKSHKLKNENEYQSILRGIELLSNKFPKTIEKPTSIKKNIIKKNSSNDDIYLEYKQKKLNPWISENYITGEQLFNLAQTVLSHQSTLLENGLCLVDARPNNYWLALNYGKLVDLAGIKPITQQNFLSFETDFRNFFINPLLLEKDLNIPVSLYFQGKLNNCQLNLWGLSKSLYSLRRIKELTKLSLINYASNKISSSSPEFVDFLLDNSKGAKEDINNKKLQKSNMQLIKLIGDLKPNKIESSNWANYDTFHDSSYTKKKINFIRKFVKKNKNSTKIVDLGSNLTTREIENIDLRIDNDMSVCREMRQFFGNKEIILQLDIAETLCNYDSSQESPINLYNNAKATIMTSIVHHLVIDYGLDIELFYKNLAKLYDNVLFEFPNENDSMVQLLISKKNEEIFWNWDDQHLPICDKYFKFIYKEDLSPTRFMVELESKFI